MIEAASYTEHKTDSGQGREGEPSAALQSMLAVDAFQFQHRGLAGSRVRSFRNSATLHLLHKRLRLYPVHLL